MEKIKQALELARQQQNRTDTTTPVEKIVENANEQIVTKDSVDAIQYSKTRIVQLDPETLVRNRIISGNENDQVGSAYGMLRTRVLQKLVANDWNSLAVTSPGPHQGKTTTTINLAISLAREVNYSVLLVDFDLKRPGIHRHFGIQPQAGISDFLLHDKPLSDLLINPGIKRLVVLPGRESLTNSSEMLKSKKMKQLVDELKNRYPSRIIIFDLPPLLVTDDALAFSPFVESLLLVVEEGKTSKDEIEQSLALLKGTNIMGTVLNKSRDFKKTVY